MDILLFFNKLRIRSKISGPTFCSSDVMTYDLDCLNEKVFLCSTCVSLYESYFLQ